MASHARLKNEFTEDEKYHSLMGLLDYNCLIDKVLTLRRAVLQILQIWQILHALFNLLIFVICVFIRRTNLSSVENKAIKNELKD